MTWVNPLLVFAMAGAALLALALSTIMSLPWIAVIGVTALVFSVAYLVTLPAIFLRPWCHAIRNDRGTVYLSSKAALAVVVDERKPHLVWQITAHLAAKRGGHGKSLRAHLAAPLLEAADLIGAHITARAVNKYVLELYRRQFVGFGLDQEPGRPLHLFREPRGQEL